MGVEPRERVKRRHDLFLSPLVFRNLTREEHLCMFLNRIYEEKGGGAKGWEIERCTNEKFTRENVP